MPFKIIDLTGKKIARWTVLHRGKNDSGGWARWVCQCECGTISLISRSSLRSGRSTGCKTCAKKNNKHGFSRSPTYKVWDSMIQRCHNPNHASFIHYGGRGIEVSTEWRKDFLNFINDMGQKPKNLSLDRINNDLGYFKENCRWATSKEQNRKRRDSVKIGHIYSGWELIKRFDHPRKSEFVCIHCKISIIYDTSHVKTGRKICPCQRETLVHYIP